uniref:Uncharacterized protein n=1 Tax=viral metagenome TaxID=1070528 RepID=A0A6C0HMK1_9ZZZZ
MKLTLKKTKKQTTTQSKTQKNIQNVYYILDNRNKPFKVVINGKTIKILKNLDKYLEYEKTPSLTFNANKIFIGYSPKTEMTLISDGYGPKYNGNSILLYIKDNEYVYIGHEIYSFTSISEIIKYVSPVGNNDVPYPYAIDKDNNIYLMIENVILLNKFFKNLNSSSIDITNDKFDPYRIYYDNCNLNLDFYIESEQYKMKYEPFPIKDYKRLTDYIGKRNSTSKTGNRKNLYIKFKGNPNKTLLTSKSYVKLLTDFGNKMGYLPLKTKIIQKRL